MAVLVGSACESGDPAHVAVITEEESIATVNSTQIPLGVFQKELGSFLQRYRQLVDWDERQLGVVRKLVIDRLIKEELIAQEASRKGIQVSPEDLESIKNKSLAPYQGANLSRILKGTSIDEEQWKYKLARLLAKERLVQTEVTDRIVVTKREIRQYYQEHKNEMTVPEAFRVRNITLSTRAEAEAVAQKIKKGENFVQLVRDYSVSPDKSVDGDLGYIEEGDLPEVMQNAIFQLGFRRSKKQWSGIVEAQDGFHIFRLLSYRKKRRLSLSQSTSKIRDILANGKRDAAYAKWIERLKEKAKITIDHATLESEQGY